MVAASVPMTIGQTQTSLTEPPTPQIPPHPSHLPSINHPDPGGGLSTATQWEEQGRLVAWRVWSCGGAPKRAVGRLMGIFTAKHLCCWCLKPPDEAKPFWTPDSDEANVTSSTHEEYTNATFESDAGTSTPTSPNTVGAKKGPPAPGRAVGSSDSSRPSPRSPKSPLKSPLHHRTGSESESEDSMSLAHSETASDQSDLETRIRALSEDLRRRKLEAERLKKEAKKHQKERLRQEEAALHKQIEAYDKYIAEARLEITDDAEPRERAPASAVQPQIKRPMPGQKKHGNEHSPKETTPRRLEGDASRPSSSIEAGGESPGQPTPLSPITPGGHEELRHDKGISFTDSISEGIMSPLVNGKKTSTPEDKSMVESRSRVGDATTSGKLPTELSTLGDSALGDVKLRLDLSRTEEPIERTEPLLSVTEHSTRSITEDIHTETVTSTASSTSRTRNSEQSSIPRSKSRISKSVKSQSEISLKSQSDKSLKSQSKKSAKSQSEKSLEKSQFEKSLEKSQSDFPHSKSEKSDSVSKNSISESSYTDEFTGENGTERSSPRQPKGDHSVSLPKPKKISHGTDQSMEEDSIHTEEEVSEQLDAEWEDEQEEEDDDGVVMLDLDLDVAPVNTSSVAVTEPKTPDPIAHLNIGDRVLVGGAQPGILRFKGNVKFTTGYFGGVELDKSEGTNNGSKDGVEYFRCSDRHGIFAPPEKLQPMPAKWAKNVAEYETSESDVSEATVQETAEDASKIAELRKDVTKHDHERKVSSSSHDAEDNLSIAEDISVATTVDSELERVISSAAAAVESFGAENFADDQLDATSPVDFTVTDALSSRPNLEQVVDRITDGILHMVVQDSMESVGEITHKVIAERESSNVDSLPAPLKQKAGAVPSDSSATPSTTAAADDDLESQAKTKPPISGGDKVVEVATQKLLSESISQMLTIYKKKQKTGDKEVREVGEPPAVKTWPADSAPDPSLSQPEVRQPDILRLDDNGFDPFPGLSNDFNLRTDDLDELYSEMEAITGDSDEWFDDDFGLGLEKRAPPPYPGTPQDKKDKSDGSDLRLDLRNVTQEPFFIVPHRLDEVRGLVERAVDVFWELRRYGESWADVTSPPAEYLKPDDGIDQPEMEAGNQRAYKQLVFQLTGEVLTDIYQHEEAEEEEPCSWMPPRRTRQRYYRGRTPPTVRDLVQPVVEAQVLRLSGLRSDDQASDRADDRLAKWSSRKKRDRVDNVLLQELVEEEPDWVDYNTDETTVKMHIADSIFDSLLVETAAIFTKIAQRRSV